MSSLSWLKQKQQQICLLHEDIHGGGRLAGLTFIALAGKTDSKGGKEKGSTYTRVPKENYT